MFDYNQTLLKSFNFIVGERDPNMNRAFEGRYMVAEAYEPGTVQDDAQGGDGVWCIVGDDLEFLCAEAVAFFEMQGASLHCGGGIDPTPIHYVMTKEDDQITVTFEDDRMVWIEKEGDRIRVHCYRPGQDEPMNVEIDMDKIGVWTEA